MIGLNANIQKLIARKRFPSDHEGGGAGAAMVDRPDLSWVDEFITRVRPYVTVREDDNLLIRMPNQAHKLNPQGVKVLKYLLDGGSAAGLIGRASTGQQALDIGLFLFDIRRCLDGTLREDNRTTAVDVGPLVLNFSTLPVLSEVAVTSRCNLRCAFCYAGCSCSSRPAGKGGFGDEMTTPEIKLVLERIYRDAKVPSVSFTGGEPSLRDDLCELVSHAKGLGFWVNLITNGTRIDREFAAKLRATGLDAVQVSLEGSSPAVHDKLTGVWGSFDRTVVAVRHLRDAGLNVHTNTTLNLWNLDDVTGLPHYIHDHLELKRFSMNLVIPSGTAATSDELLLRYSDVGVVLEEVIAASGQCGIDFMWYSPTPLCIFNPITHGLGNKGCSACDGLLSVDPGGDVLPCSSFAEPVGNMLEDDFIDIWQSGRARSLRLKSLAHDSCKSCDSFAVCHGACPLYWQHFGFGELRRQEGLEPDLTQGAVS